MNPTPSDPTVSVSLRTKAAVPISIILVVALGALALLVYVQLQTLRTDVDRQLVEAKRGEIVRAVDRAGREALDKAAIFS